MFNKFPWTNLYNLNLDWILEKFKRFESVLGNIEETGFVRTVNTQTGDVNLSARDVGAIPANDTNVQLNNVDADNWSLWRNASGTATGIKFDKASPYAEIVNGSNRYKVYSEGNPPTYPVTKVNNKTGAVTLSASDVGARASNWTPSAADINARNINTVFGADAGVTINQLDLPDLFSRGYRVILTKRLNDTNYTTIYGLERAENGQIIASSYDPSELAGAVTSVNNMTGAVTITAGDLGAVTKVNEKTGVVTLSAADVGARPANWMPPVASDSQDGLMAYTDKIALNELLSVGVEDSGDGYLQLKNGTMFCWGSISKTIDVTTREEAMYYVNVELSNAVFAKPFVGNYPIIFGCNRTGFGMIGVSDCNLTNVGWIKVLSPKSLPSYSLNYRYLAIGRWKA